MVQIMARPFFKTSGFGYTVDCLFSRLLSPVFGGRFLNARYVNLSRTLINIAVYSESYDIL